MSEETKPQADEAVKADGAQETPSEAEASTEAPDVAAEGDDEGPQYQVKAKPELDDETRAALKARAQKQRKNPRFRRQEWFRYKKLGGRHAPWRSPRGMHSKMRMNLKYRPDMVRIGYRTPAAARGLHASGFEEVLVYRPVDLEDLDPKVQAARIGGTVGGRKAAAIQEKADEMGIRILNRRDL